MRQSLKTAVKPTLSSFLKQSSTNLAQLDINALQNKRPVSRLQSKEKSTLDKKSLNTTKTPTYVNKLVQKENLSQVNSIQSRASITYRAKNCPLQNARRSVSNSNLQLGFGQNKTVYNFKATESKPDIAVGPPTICFQCKKPQIFLAFEAKFNCSKCSSLTYSNAVYPIKLETEIQSIQVSPQALLHYMIQNELKQNVNINFRKSLVLIRSKLVDVICNVGETLKQSALTVHLALRFLDRMLTKLFNQSSELTKKQGEFTEQQMQDLLFGSLSADTLAVSCLVLASKFDELDDNIPMMLEVQKAYIFSSKSRKINKQPIKFQDLIQGEAYVLNLLEWDLNSVTFYGILQNYVFQGVFFSTDTMIYRGQPCLLRDLEQASIDMLMQRAHKYLKIFAELAAKQSFSQSDLQLSSHTFTRQQIAMSIIWCARKALKIQPTWNQSCFQHLSGIQAKEIFRCFALLYHAFDITIQESDLKLELNNFASTFGAKAYTGVNDKSNISHISTGCGSGENSSMAENLFVSDQSSLLLIEDKKENQVPLTLATNKNHASTTSLAQSLERLTFQSVRKSCDILKLDIKIKHSIRQSIQQPKQTDNPKSKFGSRSSSFITNAITTQPLKRMQSKTVRGQVSYDTTPRHQFVSKMLQGPEQALLPLRKDSSTDYFSIDPRKTLCPLRVSDKPEDLTVEDEGPGTIKAANPSTKAKLRPQSSLVQHNNYNTNKLFRKQIKSSMIGPQLEACCAPIKEDKKYLKHTKSFIQRTKTVKPITINLKLVGKSRPTSRIETNNSPKDASEKRQAFKNQKSKVNL